MRLRSRSGQSLVEFALTLPLLLAVVFGAIEFGVAMYDKAVLTNASREGARAGVISKTPRLTDAQIQAVVTAYAQSNMISFKTASLTTTVTPANRTNSGVQLSVLVTYNYGFLVLPKFLTSLAGTLNLRASTVMRME